jgi:twinkle protein
MESPTDDALSVQDVIAAAEPYLSTFGHKRGLVIDPWNELEHWRPSNLTETEYVSQTLSFVRNWARRNKVHVWIVAHPQKMRREEGKLPIPRPDMIAGSQHWWNKADCAVTVFRDFEKLDSQDVDVYVQKVRFKHIGRPGFVTLQYDRVTGRYFEKPAHLRVVKDGRPIDF